MRMSTVTAVLALAVFAALTERRVGAADDDYWDCPCYRLFDMGGGDWYIQCEEKQEFAGECYSTDTTSYVIGDYPICDCDGEVECPIGMDDDPDLCNCIGPRYYRVISGGSSSCGKASEAGPDGKSKPAAQGGPPAVALPIDNSNKPDFDCDSVRDVLIRDNPRWNAHVRHCSVARFEYTVGGQPHYAAVIRLHYKPNLKPIPGFGAPPRHAAFGVALQVAPTNPSPADFVKIRQAPSPKTGRTYTWHDIYINGRLYPVLAAVQ